MKERFRGKSRDELTRTLNSIGLKAELAERGQAEEKIHNPFFMRTLGIINVPDGQIKRINTLKKDGTDKSPPI